MTESHNAPDERNDALKLAAAADAYGLLTLLTQFPAEDAACGTANGAIASDMMEILHELGLGKEDQRLAELRRAIEDLSATPYALADLRREYTRLFNHPDKPVIFMYEALYLYAKRHGEENVELSSDKAPRMFVNSAALDAERCYKSSGLGVSSGTQFPPDSMYVEMEYTSKLFERIAKYTLEKSPEPRRAAQERLEEFARIHLDKWMKSFYRDCAAKSSCALYRAVGVFGRLVYDATRPAMDLTAAK